MVIRDLPLIWRTISKPFAPRPNGVPERMDFAWDWDAAVGLLKQKVTPELRTALSAIYAAGSENLGATESYGRVFTQFFLAYAPAEGSILDIGGGRGALSPGWFPETKLEVYTVDPSARPSKCDPLGQRVHAATFPCVLPVDWQQQYEIVMAHHVLEHVEDPVAFLAACRRRLKPGGALVLAVPDCSESVELGDVSMACHQHINYFTRRSLMTAAREAGFGDWVLDARGGTLLMMARSESGRERAGHIAPECLAAASFGRFAARSAANGLRLGMLLDGFGHQGIGVYVPMRYLPYRPRLAGERLFDDTMASLYLDGVPPRIQEIADFYEDQVDVMFVMSLTHERAIVEKIGGRCKVITLREMLNG